MMIKKLLLLLIMKKNLDLPDIINNENIIENLSKNRAALIVISIENKKYYYKIIGFNMINIFIYQNKYCYIEGQINIKILSLIF